MFEWLKKLRSARIYVTINIVYPAQGVQRITNPVPVVEDAPVIRRRHQSNYRFVGVKKIRHDGDESFYYHTEYKDGKDWRFVDNTLSANKEEAMQLHLKYVEKGSLKPVETKTVYWEGLDLEETATWVLLQTENKDE